MTSIFIKDRTGTVEGNVTGTHAHLRNIETWQHRKGHGRRLFLLFAREAQNHGATQIALEVAPYAGKEARKFFRALGFRGCDDHMEKEV